LSGILGEYTEIFLEESEDQIEELNGNLLRLEQDHTDTEIINDIFRAAHSLKSSAAFVGLYNLSDLAHKMENLLQRIREGTLAVNTDLVTLLFECFDLIKNVIDSVGQGKKVDTSYSYMIDKLADYEKTHSSGGAPVKETPKPKVDKAATPVQPVVAQTHQQEAPAQVAQTPVVTSQIDLIPLPIDEEELHDIEEEMKIRGAVAYDVFVGLRKDTPMKGLRFTLILQNLKSTGVVFKSDPEIEQLEQGTDRNNITFILITKSSEKEVKYDVSVDMVETIIVKPRVIQTPQNLTAKDNASQEPASTGKDSSPKKETKLVGDAGDKVTLKSIKVSSEKLDQLMNNVGELVITNSGFQKIYDDLIRKFGDDVLLAELKSKIDQINRISKDLQSGIMNTRMVPIGSVFNRFSRLVRDLSIETKKKVKLNLMGENTELDKKVVDMIGEPLLHLIRNSIDHGIENPEERLKNKKPEYGTVELNAYQGGNNIMVEIRDDGKGLNKERILKKAIDVGLITQSEAGNLSDNDIYQFIFAPGFSTSSEITDISGRGVGMNVVNKLIQDFKGKILINTQEGLGTSFTLCFPQALAIIPSILVSMEEEIYAFPLSEVFETIRVQREQINTLEGHEIINLRGEVLPIYRLNKILHLATQKDVEEFPVVIVNFNSRKLGFIVDDLIGKHETVIKTLEKNFKNVIGITGASLMGDGTIIIVLDIPGLIEIASNQNLMSQSGLLDGDFMKRLNTTKSIDLAMSDTIYKTKNSTNLFNTKLHAIKSIVKTRHKKEKPQVVKKQEEFRKQQPEVEFKKSETVTESRKPDPTFESKKAEPISEPKKSEPVFESKKQETTPKKDTSSAFDSGAKDEDIAKEIRKSINEQMQSRANSIMPERNIGELLSKDEIRKLESVVNTGMMNAGLVLSQLVGSNVELYMPEITLTDKDSLSEEFRYTNEVLFGMKVRMNGELNGNLLMIISEERGSELSGKLLNGSENSDIASKLSEDSISMLSEISNIVCASIINSLSNKSKSQIMPSVPELITGTLREVIDFVKPEKTKFLSMNTEFIYDGGNLIGNLLFLPDFDELVRLIAKLP
jgi:two-component system, chemotaxis family, sensor kinase CheA